MSRRGGLNAVRRSAPPPWRGAGPPTGVKWRIFRDDPAPDELHGLQPAEGEPGTFQGPLADATEGAGVTETLAGTELEMDRVVPGTPMTAAPSGAQVSLWDLR